MSIRRAARWMWCALRESCAVPASVSLSLPYRPFQRRGELLQVQPERLAERPHFDHVNAPLPSLALGHEGLGLTDLPGELHLRQAGLFACVPQDLEEDGVSGGVDGFFHCVSGKRNGIRLLAQDRIVQNRLFGQTQRNQATSPRSNSPK